MAPGLLLLASCGAHISGNSADPDAAAARDAAAGADAAPDALSFGPWLPAAAVTVAATPAVEDDVTLSSNALEMIFAIAVSGKKDLYYTARTAIGAAWATPSPLPFDSEASEETPRFSGDDSTLYFASDRTTAGNLDIYAVSRTAAGNATWGAPQLFANLHTTATEKWLAPCSGNHYVVVQSTAAGDTDLFEGTLGGGAPAPIDVVNTASTETGAFLTPDCLTLYFASTRVTPERIYVTHRATIGSPWQMPSVVDDFRSTGGNQEDPWLALDGRTFAFASDAGGSKDIYLSTR